MNIIRYKLAKDGKGLVGYFREHGLKKGRITYYHIHFNELSPLEKWIKRILKKL